MANETSRASFANNSVELVRQFLSQVSAKKLSDFLGLNDFEATSVEWEQLPVKMFGKSIPQPRLIAWFGDEGVPYTYSGLTLAAKAWPKELEELRQLVEAETGQIFNFALLNYYRDGEDYMGWHRDNEKSLGADPYVASVSLGVTRAFKLRHRESKQSITIDLGSGDLMLMKPKAQEVWEHAVPKRRSVKGARINISFRRVIAS